MNHFRLKKQLIRIKRTECTCKFCFRNAVTYQSRLSRSALVPVSGRSKRLHAARRTPTRISRRCVTAVGNLSSQGPSLSFHSSPSNSERVALTRTTRFKAGGRRRPIVRPSSGLPMKAGFRLVAFLRKGRNRWNGNCGRSQGRPVSSIIADVCLETPMPSSIDRFPRAYLNEFMLFGAQEMEKWVRSKF